MLRNHLRKATANYLYEVEASSFKAKQNRSFDRTVTLICRLFFSSSFGKSREQQTTAQWIVAEIADNASGCESRYSIELLRIPRRSRIHYVVGFADKVPERTKFPLTMSLRIIRGERNSSLSGFCCNKFSAHQSRVLLIHWVLFCLFSSFLSFYFIFFSHH